MVTRRSRRRRQGGQALIVLALVGMAMFSFGAYAVDQGMSMADRRTLQAVADAAALAGSRSLSSGTATANYVAMQYLAANLNLTIPATCTSTSCPAGSYTPTGSDYTITFADGSGTLDVSLSHTRSTLIAKLMGETTATTASGSRAGSITVTMPCAMCLLTSSGSAALSMTMSSGGVSITGGNLVIDSSSSTAASIVGSGTVTTTAAARIVGSYQVTGTGGFSPAPTTGAAVVSDPLSSVPTPSVSGTASTFSLVGTSGTISPGIYSSISAIGTGTTLTMSPGIYVITGSFSTTGAVTVAGTGVLLYFACSSYPTACSSGQGGGSLSLTGTGSFQVTAPTASTCSSIPATCPYEGMLVYYDRNNTSGMSIVGNGSGPTGTIYGKSSTLTLVTSGGVTDSSQIVVAGVSFTGSGSLTVNYQSGQNYAVTTTGGLLR
jgi:Flp pilus assembly protein TadG